MLIVRHDPHFPHRDQLHGFDHADRVYLRRTRAAGKDRGEKHFGAGDRFHVSADEHELPGLFCAWIIRARCWIVHLYADWDESEWRRQHRAG